MQQWYQCPRCGAQVAFGAGFCNNCGTQLNWPTQQQPPPQYQQQYQQASYYQHSQREHKQKKTSSWLIISITLMVVVLLVVGGVFAFDRFSQGTPSSTSSTTTPPPAPASAPPSEPTPTTVQVPLEYEVVETHVREDSVSERKSVVIAGQTIQDEVVETPLFVACVTVKNKDTVSGTFQVFFTVTTPFIEELTQGVLSLAPGESKTIECPAYELGDWNYVVHPSTKLVTDSQQPAATATLPPLDTTPYYGPQLLAPNNGCLGCPVKPASFSWSPFKETTKYKFVLAKDAAMTQVVTEAAVTATAFEYDGTLNYSTNYFWRVMSLEPAPSDWSATFSFLTEAAPR